MTDLPERIELPAVIFAGPATQNQIEAGEFDDGDWDISGETIAYAEYATRYLRADTAIPRAEAEAMVQEAVEAERERCAKIASEAKLRWPAGISDYSRGALGEAAFIAAAIRAPQETSE